MEIFKLFGRIMVDSAEAEKSIQKTESKAKKMADGLVSGVKTAAKWGAGVAAAAVGVGAAMVAAAKGTASSLDAIDKGSQRMGLTAEKYQELAYAAGLCGVEMGTLEDAAKTLKSKGLDISVDEALAQLMSIGDESTRDAAAFEMFGEAAYKLTPLLSAGTDGMNAMRQEAHDLGLVMSDEAVTAGAAMNDSFSKVEQVIGAVKNNVMIGLMPAVQKILDWVIANMPLIQETISSVVNAIIPLVDPVLEFFMTNAPPVFQAIIDAVNALLPVVEAVVGAVSGLFSGLFALLNGDVEGFTTGVTGFFQGMAEAILSIIETLFGSDFANTLAPLLDGITALFTGFMDLLNGDFQGFVDGIVGFFTGLVATLTDLGSQIMNGLWSGLQSVWGSISSWISGVVNSITDWFSGIGARIASFFGFGGDGDTDGSHASGLASVPYDGYRATLHRGETVLNPNDTAKLVELLQNGSGGGGDDRPIQITTQVVLDGRIIGQSVTKYQRRKERTAGAS